MTTYDVTAITDRNLIARFGLDAREIGEETLRLAESEIGLREWQPTPEDLAAFERVHELEALNEEMLKTDNFRNLLVSQAADMRVVLLLIAGCVVLMRLVQGQPRCRSAPAPLDRGGAHLRTPRPQTRTL